MNAQPVRKTVSHHGFGDQVIRASRLPSDELDSGVYHGLQICLIRCLTPSAARADEDRVLGRVASSEAVGSQQSKTDSLFKRATDGDSREDLHSNSRLQHPR